MQPSKYNYYIEDNQSVIFFNGLTEASFRVPFTLAEPYKIILNNPDYNNKQYPSFIKKMKDDGFIIDNDTDENELLSKKYFDLILPENYCIMVMPTYQCNLRCWYCVQEHADQWLSDEAMNRIKKRIKYVVESKSVKRVSIMWFGGEPLLAYNNVISLTTWANEYCKSHEIKFSASITTNATLLNKDKIDELKKAGVIHYQITIDGNRDTHNKIKKLGNKSAFDVTLRNIGYIIEHTECTLRFNYTKENFNASSIISELDAVLPKNRKNLSFFIYKVWQEQKNTVTDEEIRQMMDMSLKIGIKPHLSEISMCYADRKYFDTAFADGSIGKCDNMNPCDIHGEINNNGEVHYSADTSCFKPTFEVKNAVCHNCRFLPVCWGPCVVKRYDELNKDGNITCHFINNEEEIYDSIKRTQLNREYSLKYSELYPN